MPDLDYLKRGDHCVLSFWNLCVISWILDRLESVVETSQRSMYSLSASNIVCDLSMCMALSEYWFE